MRKQTIVWTAVPNRSQGSVAEGATLRLSILASPRLWNDDPTVKKMALAEFPDWLDWPALIGQASFQLEFDGGQTVAGTADASALDSAQWKALFKDTTDVVPFVFEDLSGAELISFPAIDLHEAIKGIYQRAATDAGYGAGGDLPGRPILETDPDLVDIARPVRPEPPFVPEDPDRGPVVLDGPEHKPPGTGPPPEAERPSDPLGCLLWLLLLPFRLLRRLLKALGLLANLPLLVLLWVLPTRVWLSNSGGAGGGAAGGGAGGGGIGVGSAAGGDRPAFRELREYLAPTSPDSSDLPKTQAEMAGVYDFHQMIAALGDYPLLMRRLGLVVDLTFSVPAGGLPSTGSVRVVPSLPLSSPTTNYSPRTHYQLDEDRFLPRPRVANADLANGLLRLNDATRFQLQQVDVVGAAVKLQNAATNVVGLRALGEVPVNSPTEEGLPALQSAGIAVARPDVRTTLRDRFRRSFAFNRALAAQDGSPVKPIGSGGADPAPDGELFAEDLLRGLRIDLRDEAAGGWLSLCQRIGSYEFVDLAGPPFEGADEGFVQSSATEPLNPGAVRVMRVHETLFSWDGWSLAAPRPGRAIAAGGDNHEELQNEAATPFGLEVTYSPVKGSLPRLRYGHTYRVRARAVDICGNSAFDPGEPAFDDDQPEVSAAFDFRRFEPIGPPPVMLRSVPKEGESLERVTVRSAVTDSAASIAGQVSERHLAPSKGAQLLAERHGHFDGPQQMRADAAGYALAAREAGSLTDQLDLTSGDLVPVPGVSEEGDPAEKRRYFLQSSDIFEARYVPDPFARGVLLLGLPGLAGAVVDDDVNRLPFDGTWPSLRSMRLRVRGAPAGATPATPDWNATDRLLTVEVPQGETYTVRLASYFHEADLDQMGVWGWTEEAAPPDLATLRTKAVEGRNWLHLPFRELALVHAVQQPLAIPQITSMALDPAKPRGLGETAVALAGQLALDAKSTGKVDLSAAWSDPIDDPDLAGNDPATSRVEQVMHVRELVLADGADDAPSFAKIVSDMGDGSKLLLHQVGDTKYHRIDYTPVATTRFREHFPDSVVADVTKLVRPLPGESPVVTSLDVPNTRRPDAVRPQSVLPVFQWEESETGGVRTRSRRGGGLRVYVQRPWWSTGDGELLGVLLRRGDAPLTGEDGERMRKYTSEWGVDPLWDSAETLPLQLSDFVNPSHAGADLPLAEVAGVAVDAAGFAPAYDSSRGLWYADVEMAVDERYFPFVRLALARYQPISVAGAEISRVVLSDFVQLAPHRRADYDLNGALAGGTLPLRVSGWAHRTTDGPGFGRTFVIARLERRQHGDDGTAEPVGWEAIETVVLDRVTGNDLQAVWEGEVPLPGSLPSPLRVAVYEAQMLRTDGRPIGDVLGLLELAGSNPAIAGLAEEQLAAGRAGYRVVYADATVVA